MPGVKGRSGGAGRGADRRAGRRLVQPETFRAGILRARLLGVGLDRSPALEGVPCR